MSALEEWAAAIEEMPSDEPMTITLADFAERFINVPHFAAADVAVSLALGELDGVALL